MSILKHIKRFNDFDNRWWYTGYQVDFLLLDIEVSPIEYKNRLTYAEAMLYCFSLNIDGKTGWRLPTWDEANRAGLYHGEFYVHSSDRPTWLLDDKVFAVRPVRDVKYNIMKRLICKLFK